MSLEEVMQELSRMGNENSRKVLMHHGAREPFFGVKIQDLKKIQKKVKKDHALALQLFDTGNSDAMYLAGLISDPKQMTRDQLQKWAEKAYWYLLSEYTVAWVTAESPCALEMARQWIRSDKENVASAGWSTYASYISITPDEKLDVKEVEALLDYISTNIHQSPNRVRYTMNGFVISAGAYVSILSGKAFEIAEKVGKVKVDMGETACKVPFAKEYIEKIDKMGKTGKKRKTAFC